MALDDEVADLDLSDVCFKQYILLIHEYTGITLANNRKAMLLGRLRKRIRVLKQGSCEEYFTYITKNSTEKPIFIDLITTNETRFFRTPRVWDYIQLEFIPQWFEKNPHQVFRIWSAAASSGEEAHSLGVICQEFKTTHPRFQYQILATDISDEMVALGERGIYTGRSLENFQKTKPKLFEKFMKLVENSGSTPSYCASPEIRAQIKFKRHNLFECLDVKEKFDLILLRNVLIYFVREDQEKVLSNLRPSLSDAGNLIIGESESLAYVKSEFENIQSLIYTVKKSDEKNL